MPSKQPILEDNAEGAKLGRRVLCIWNRDPSHGGKSSISGLFHGSVPNVKAEPEGVDRANSSQRDTANIIMECRLPLAGPQQPTLTLIS